MSPIQFQLLTHQTESGLTYQHLHVQIATPDGLIEPQDLKGLSLPADLIWSQGVVIEGKAPIWLYGYLVHACHATLWVACYDPRLGDPTPRSGGAVVVATHSHTIAVGQVLSIHLPDRLFQQDPTVP